MYFEDDILFFISLIRDSVPNAVEVFTQGNCGAFALILLKTFPGGRILSNIDHRVYEYNGNYYDITGKISYEQTQEDIMYREMEDIVERYGLYEAIMLLKPKYDGK